MMITSPNKREDDFFMSENELVAVDNSTAPTNISNSFDIVDVEAAKDFMNNYQDLVKALLDKSDYQMIRTKDGMQPKKKKSAWRKLATAFNISDDIVEEEIIRDECHRIISAKFVVKATLPNGRYGMGLGDCSIYDKVKKDDEKEPTPFELRKRFNNAEHDVISTAHTRAKSRAISDLVGGGEVSAEELSGMDSGSIKPKKPVKPKPGKPQSKVSNSSTMGNKPKAPKSIHDKVKEGVPITQAVDEAIEVEVVAPKEPAKPNLASIIDSNQSIRLAVDELQAQEITVDRPHIQDKLLDLMDMGKINADDYKEAKKLLE